MRPLPAGLEQRLAAAAPGLALNPVPGDGALAWRLADSGPRPLLLLDREPQGATLTTAGYKIEALAPGGPRLASPAA